jgi:hypothetical protein
MRPTLEFVGVGRHGLERIEGSVDVLEPLLVGTCRALRVHPRSVASCADRNPLRDDRDGL